MTPRFLALALLVGLVVAQAGTHARDGHAQPSTKQDAPPAAEPAVRRELYTVRHADPAALATALGKHYSAERRFTAVPAGFGNGLLLSGSPAAVAEVVTLLDQLDRKPRTVEVEVVLAEVAAKKRDDGMEAAAPELPAADPLGGLDAMTKSGMVVTVQRVKLTGVEGQPVSSTTGGNKPITTAMTVLGGGGREVPGGGPGGAAGGRVQRSVTYHSVGTTVKLTPRVGRGDVVALDLSVQQSGVRPPEAGEDGPAMLDTGTLTTTLSVPPGRAVTAQAIRTEAKAAKTVTLVVVTARVVDPAAGNR